MINLTDFSDEVYMLIYGDDINIMEIRKQKTYTDVWNDIIIYLAKDDITKIDEIRNMNFIKTMIFLDSKVKTNIAKRALKPKEEIKPIGFKLNSENEK